MTEVNARYGLLSRTRFYNKDLHVEKGVIDKDPNISEHH